MNDEYAILAAKTEYREAYNNANVDRLLAVFAPEFTDWSEGEPSFDGKDSQLALRLRTEKLFQCFNVQMQVTIIAVIVKATSPMTADRTRSVSPTRTPAKLLKPGTAISKLGRNR